MKNVIMAKDYAGRAIWHLKEAENAFEGRNYAVCVRRCQEALELSAKATLRRLAIEYPREHDVSEALQASADLLPGHMRKILGEIEAIMIELARVRGPAFYGYEAEGIPASEAFTQQYAEETLKKVKPLVDIFAKFASE